MAKNEVRDLLHQNFRLRSVIVDEIRRLRKDRDSLNQVIARLAKAIK